MTKEVVYEQFCSKCKKSLGKFVIDEEIVEFTKKNLERKQKCPYCEEKIVPKVEEVKDTGKYIKIGTD